ncbi:FlhC family transcriptional regulator [Thiocapsa bogorovii]|uniref:FlhC family transcriptional regulator n=1 Tax=Thiocapsa bogorovii TaxID=521689 RepID=UPI001E5A7BB7|nr:FlhC family transcriptional regulator [Thiocapsa bogorovii]UHD16521.1 flagellar transcriptional regulator FlhC [Thiocapsa bogorovii]
MRLQHHARTQLAIALIRRGMRTSLVGRISGLRPAVLRELHHEIHGCKPLPGQLPSTGSLLGTTRRQANASLFTGLYRAFGGAAVQRCIDIEALLTGHRLYLEQMAGLTGSDTLGPPIDINHGWVIARDLTTGLVLFRNCERCAIPYLAGAFSRRAVDCPICALKVSRTVRDRKEDAPPKPLASSTSEQRIQTRA